MKTTEHSHAPRPMDPCQRRRQFGPVQPMPRTNRGEDIFEALFTRLLTKVKR